MGPKCLLVICLVGAVLSEPPVAPYPAAGGPQGGFNGLPEVIANRAQQDNSPTHTITFNLFKDHQPVGKDAKDQSRQGGQGYPSALQKYNPGRSQPSPNYGAPRSQPSQAYGTPQARQPSGSYGPPGFEARSSQPQASSAPSSSYGTPHNAQNYASPPQSYNSAENFASQPSQSYGAPAQGRQAPSNSYGPPSASFGNAGRSAPSASYGAPSASFGSSARSAPSSNYGAPSPFSAPNQSYGPPSFRMDHHTGNSIERNASPKSTYGAPKSTYGVPDSAYGAPQRRMGYSDNANGRSLFDSEGSTEMPHEVNYEFEYEVHGDRTHSHEESREGEEARGSYRVQLPDGRVQLVEYTADRRGFRPRISYLDGEDSQGPY